MIKLKKLKTEQFESFWYCFSKALTNHFFIIFIVLPKSFHPSIQFHPSPLSSPLLYWNIVDADWMLKEVLCPVCKVWYCFQKEGRPPSSHINHHGRWYRIRPCVRPWLWPHYTAGWQVKIAARQLLGVVSTGPVRAWLLVGGMRHVYLPGGHTLTSLNGALSQGTAWCAKRMMRNFIQQLRLKRWAITLWGVWYIHTPRGSIIFWFFCLSSALIVKAFAKAYDRVKDGIRMLLKEGSKRYSTTEPVCKASLRNSLQWKQRTYCWTLASFIFFPLSFDIGIIFILTFSLSNHGQYNSKALCQLHYGPSALTSSDAHTLMSAMGGEIVIKLGWGENMTSWGVEDTLDMVL